MKLSHRLALGAALGIAITSAAIGLQRLGDLKGVGSHHTLRVAQMASMSTLDSTGYSTSIEAEALNSTMVGLYHYNAKGKAVAGLVAGKPKVSKDNLTYTFKLRKSYWSNGDPVTAQDFVYAWQRLADPNLYPTNASRADIFANGQAIRMGKMAPDKLGAKALDSHTLKVTLSGAYPYIKDTLTGPSYLPLNQASVEHWGTRYGNSSDHMVTNGPYTLQDWHGSADHEWTMKKNPHFFDAANVSIKKIAFIVQPTPDAAAAAFNDGDLDYTPITPKLLPNFTGTQGFHTRTTRTEGFVYFNTAKGLTANLNLRKALARSFNKHQFVRTELKTGAKPLNGLVPAGVIEDQTGRDYRQVAGQLMPYDLNAATTAWKQAKRELGVNHMTITLITADSPTAIVAGRFLQSQWQQNLPGLTVKMQSLPLLDRLKKEQTGNYTISLGTWTPASTDPVTLMEIYQSDNPRNNTQFKSHHYDQQVDEARAAGSNLTERTRAIQLAERDLLTRHVPLASFYQDGMAYLTSNHVAKLPVLSSTVANYPYAKLR